MRKKFGVLALAAALGFSLMAPGDAAARRCGRHHRRGGCGGAYYGNSCGTMNNCGYGGGCGSYGGCGTGCSTGYGTGYGTGAPMAAPGMSGPPPAPNTEAPPPPTPAPGA